MWLYSVPVACTSQCSSSSVTRDVLNIRVVDLASQKSPEHWITIRVARSLPLQDTTMNTRSFQP